MRIRRPTESRPHGLQIGRSRALVGLAIGLMGCASGAAPEDRADADPSWRGERIEALRRAIAEDHASLEDLVTQPRQPEPAPELYRNPEIQVIAERLAEHQRELAQLEALAQSRKREALP